MNTKSVLIAAFIAAATSTAFAADYVATAGNPEMQIAQATTHAQVRPAAAVAADGLTATWKDGEPVSYSGKSSLTRAEVRAQTINWLNSSNGRNTRSVYFGGAQ